MDPKGDITDAFDDDDLQQSIAAGQEGPWHDETAHFEDPKLKALEKQLKTVPKQGYKERRLNEMQARAERAIQASAKKRTAQPAAPSEASAESPENSDWGGPVDWNAANPEPKASAQAIDKQQAPVAIESTTPRIPERRRAMLPEAQAPQSVLATYAPSMIAATLVFSVTTVVHGLLDGWRIDLVYRAIIAMSLTGVMWQRFQSGRLRAMAIAAIAYLAVFAPSKNFGEPETMFALSLGMLIVVAGAGLVGVQRDELGAKTL